MTTDLPAWDPERRERDLRSEIPGDENPVPLTSVQVLKCAAIIDAYNNGHQILRPLVDDVIAFLQGTAVVAAGDKPQFGTPLEERWSRIDAAPWPQSGPPRAQPE